MKLAFVSYQYTPFGGLERDMLAMAQLCHQRSHDVVIYTGSWQGDLPSDVPVEVLPTKKAFTNQSKDLATVKAIQTRLTNTDRVIVGFNKMPGLDFYYAADSCFATKAYDEKGWLYRQTARAKQQLAFESAVFAASSHTHCLMISAPEIAEFKRHYNTPDNRLHLLPPGIRRDRVMPDDYVQQRQALRQQYGITNHQKLVVLVGSNYKLKGVDIAIRALSLLPTSLLSQTLFWVAGNDNPAPFNALAKKLGLADRVNILGARNDISQLLWAADLLVHPAHRENTGTVLLEAMVAGLPVAASSVCGYSSYISEHQMGDVLFSPVDIQALAHSIVKLLKLPREQWVERGKAFAKEDIYAMTERAAEVIEQLGSNQ